MYDMCICRCYYCKLCMCASSTTVNTRTETSQLHSEVDLPHSGAGYHLECETSRISPHLSVYTPTDWLQEPYSPIVAFLLSSSSYGIWVSQFFVFFPRHARTVLLQSKHTRCTCQSQSLASFTRGTCTSHHIDSMTRTLNTRARLLSRGLKLGSRFMLN